VLLSQKHPYYFFVAQLPMLTYGDTAPMSSEYFRDLALALLSKEDAGMLDYCKLDAASLGVVHTQSDFINGWVSRERTLRLNLAMARAAKYKRSIPGEEAHDVPRAEQSAAEALSMNNPLEAEMYMDKGRWDAIDFLVGSNHFSVNTIYAYLIKLLILERHAQFKVDEGFAEYKSLYSAISQRGVETAAG
jgi:hypothetical protein